MCRLCLLDQESPYSKGTDSLGSMQLLWPLLAEPNLDSLPKHSQWTQCHPLSGNSPESLCTLVFPSWCLLPAGCNIFGETLLTDHYTEFWSWKGPSRPSFSQGYLQNMLCSHPKHVVCGQLVLAGVFYPQCSPPLPPPVWRVEDGGSAGASQKEASLSSGAGCGPWSSPSSATQHGCTSQSSLGLPHPAQLD